MEWDVRLNEELFDHIESIDKKIHDILMLLPDNCSGLLRQLVFEITDDVRYAKHIMQESDSCETCLDRLAKMEIR